MHEYFHAGGAVDREKRPLPDILLRDHQTKHEPRDGRHDPDQKRGAKSFLHGSDQVLAGSRVASRDALKLTDHGIAEAAEAEAREDGQGLGPIGVYPGHIDEPLTPRAQTPDHPWQNLIVKVAQPVIVIWKQRAAH